MMKNQEIQEYHRHRYPYLLVDTIEELEPGKRVKGSKYFTENEWLFHCSTKENQSVPFTMLVEIMTEVFLMPILTIDDNKGKITNFLSADDVQVFDKVYPGDEMTVEATVSSWRRGIASGVAKGYVDGKLVCTAKLKFVVPDIMNQFKPTVKK